MAGEANVLEAKFKLPQKERELKFVGRVRDVQVAEGNTLKVETELKKEKHDNFLLRKNVNAFAWLSTDMLGIDPDFLCHCLPLTRKSNLSNREGGRLTWN